MKRIIFTVYRALYNKSSVKKSRVDARPFPYD